MSPLPLEFELIGKREVKREIRFTRKDVPSYSSPDRPSKAERKRHFKLRCFLFGHQFDFRGGEMMIKDEASVTWHECERCSLKREICRYLKLGINYLDKEWY